DGKERTVKIGDNTKMSSFAVVTPDGKGIILNTNHGGRDNRIEYVDLETGQIRTLSRPQNFSEPYLAISPEGDLLYIINQSHTPDRFFAVDIKTGQEVEIPHGDLTDCMTHPDSPLINPNTGEILVNSRAMGGLYVFNPETGGVMRNLVGRPLNTSAITSIDDSLFVGVSRCGAGGYIEEIRPDGTSEIITPDGLLPDAVMKIRASNDGLIYILADDKPSGSKDPSGYNPQIIVFDPHAREIVNRYELPGDAYFSYFSLNPVDGSLLVCDQWEGFCYKADKNGENITRHVIGIRHVDHLEMTDVSSDGHLYVGINPEGGYSHGDPATDRRLMEMDPDTFELRPLISSVSIDKGARITPIT
ncbi:MAG: hypothetical protein D6710_12040, partial [Nitrospirae bacterium]